MQAMQWGELKLIGKHGGAALVPLPVRVWEHDASGERQVPTRVHHYGFFSLALLCSVRLAGTMQLYVCTHGGEEFDHGVMRAGKQAEGGGRFPRRTRAVAVGAS